jgi:uncharacterized protein (TIGR02268 family)
MRLRSPGVLLALVLLAVPCLARAQATPCQTETRHIEWEAGSALPPEVCISPDLSTTVLFERPLDADSVVLEGRERFRRVEVAGSLLVLVPSQQLKAGEKLSLKVRLAGAESPRSVEFRLVVHPGQAERQLEVSFPKRAADSCTAQLQDTQAQLQRCQEEKASSQAGAEGGASILGLITAGLIDEGGISALRLDTAAFAQAPENALEVKEVTLYRSSKRLALRVKVKNPASAKPWSLEGAALLVRPGQAQEPLSLSKDPAVPSGATQLLWLEWELPIENVQRVFALRLWEVGQARPVTVQGLRLP